MKLFRRLFPRYPAVAMALLMLISVETTMIVGRVNADYTEADREAVEGGWQFDRLENNYCYYYHKDDSCDITLAGIGKICYHEWNPGHYSFATKYTSTRSCPDASTVSTANGFYLWAHEEHTRN